MTMTLSMENSSCCCEGMEEFGSGNASNRADGHRGRISEKDRKQSPSILSRRNGLNCVKKQSWDSGKWTMMSWIMISSLLVLMLAHVSTANEGKKSSSSDARKSSSTKWNWKESTSGKFNVGSGRSDLSRSQSGDVSSPLHVAQCRATCLQKFNNRGDGIKASSCFHHPDCFTCWKSCELLESSWSSSGRDDKVLLTRSRPMCSQPRLCLSGCQVACSFYQELAEKTGQSLSDPVVATSRENVLVLSEGKIQWPQKPNVKSVADFLVYVLIQEYPDHRWRQITQTTEREVEIPRGLASQKSNKLRSVRVLVVSPLGLVTMYNPQLVSTTENESESKRTSNPSSPVSSPDSTSTQVSQQNHQQENKAEANTPFPNPPLNPISTGTDSEAGVGSSGATDQWQLRRVSLIHQKFLVIAELTWNPVPEAKDYLITWELDGGGLKGHLVTDSTTVTLSLWPDTLYHIQVELFGEEHSSLHRKSFPLAVDTSEASFPMEQPSALSKKESSHKSVNEFLNVTLLVTVSSVLLVLLSLLFALCCWCRMRRARRSRDPQLLQDTDEPTDPTHPTVLRKGLREAGVAVDVIQPSQLIFPEKVEWMPVTGPWTTDSYFQNHNRQYQQTLPNNRHLQQNLNNVYLPAT